MRIKIECPLESLQQFAVELCSTLRPIDRLSFKPTSTLFARVLFKQATRQVAGLESPVRKRESCGENFDPVHQAGRTEFLNARGVIPVLRLNARSNVPKSPKPVANAISEIV